MAKGNAPEELDFINRSCRQSRKPNVERSDGIGIMRLAHTFFGKGDAAFSEGAQNYRGNLIELMPSNNVLSMSSVRIEIHPRI